MQLTKITHSIKMVKIHGDSDYNHLMAKCFRLFGGPITNQYYCNGNKAISFLLKQPRDRISTIIKIH